MRESVKPNNPLMPPLGTDNFSYGPLFIAIPPQMQLHGASDEPLLQIELDNPEEFCESEEILNVENTPDASLQQPPPFNCVVTYEVADESPQILGEANNCQMIADTVVRETIPKCKIVYGRNIFEIECAEYNREMILGLMKVQQTFLLIDEHGDVVGGESDKNLKLSDSQQYHVICCEANLDKMPYKILQAPVDFPAGISVNRPMFLLPSYFICITKVMHFLTCINADMQTPMPNRRSVAQLAAKNLCRLNDAATKIQIVATNISNNICYSVMAGKSFKATLEGMILTGNKLPTSDLGVVVEALERALNEMEEFLQVIKFVLELDPSSVEQIQTIIKVDNGRLERKERMEEFKRVNENAQLNEYKKVVERGIQICPKKTQIFFKKVIEGRKHFQFVFKIIGKLLESNANGDFSFSGLAELVMFVVEVLHYTHLHWAFIKNFSNLENRIDALTFENFFEQIKDCSKFWCNVSEDDQGPVFIFFATPLHNDFWRPSHESIIKAQYRIETMFFGSTVNE
uniref:Uncharacterized protein n=1 Tax=Panagrolaimus sp. ES5 TaxID=591445 RepID=A0AC34GNS9_9BILA